MNWSSLSHFLSRVLPWCYISLVCVSVGLSLFVASQLHALDHHPATPQILLTVLGLLLPLEACLHFLCLKRPNCRPHTLFQSSGQWNQLLGKQLWRPNVSTFISEEDPSGLWEIAQESWEYLVAWAGSFTMPVIIGLEVANALVLTFEQSALQERYWLFPSLVEENLSCFCELLQPSLANALDLPLDDQHPCRFHPGPGIVCLTPYKSDEALYKPCQKGGHLNKECVLFQTFNLFYWRLVCALAILLGCQTVIGLKWIWEIRSHSEIQLEIPGNHTDVSVIGLDQTRFATIAHRQRSRLALTTFVEDPEEVPPEDSNNDDVFISPESKIIAICVDRTKPCRRMTLSGPLTDNPRVDNDARGIRRLTSFGNVLLNESLKNDTSNDTLISTTGSYLGRLPLLNSTPTRRGHQIIISSNEQF